MKGAAAASRASSDIFEHALPKRQNIRPVAASEIVNRHTRGLGHVARRKPRDYRPQRRDPGVAALPAEPVQERHVRRSGAGETVRPGRNGNRPRVQGRVLRRRELGDEEKVGLQRMGPGQLPTALCSSR